MASTAAGTLQTEDEKSFELKGMPKNPGRDPKRSASKVEKGSIGDVALKDALCIVVGAWLILIFLAYSLRHHNV